MTATTVNTYAEAAGRICDRGDDLRIVAGMYPGQPDDLLRAVVAEARRRDIRLTILLADLTGRLRFLGGQTDPADGPGPAPRLVTIGGRAPVPPLPAADYLPNSLWEIARRFTDGSVPVDVFVGVAAPPRADGSCSLGPMLSYGPAALAAAWEAWRASDGSPAQLRELAMQAHRLAGSAGSYGYDEIGARAGALDRLVADPQDVASGTAALVDAAVRTLLDAIDAAQR